MVTSGQGPTPTSMTLDAAGMVAIVGSFMDFLPKLAGVVALLWYCVQLYESRTVQEYLTRRRLRKVEKANAVLKRGP